MLEKETEVRLLSSKMQIRLTVSALLFRYLAFCYLIDLVKQLEKQVASK